MDAACGSVTTGQAAPTSFSNDSATSAGGTWRVNTVVAPASRSGPTRSPYAALAVTTVPGEKRRT